MAEPAAARPFMPGYGIEPAEAGVGLLPWSWAEERLAASHDYWLATVWPDGRPHVAPVWGAWAEDALWFSSAPGSRKVRNLVASPHVVVTTEDARNPVVVEGTAVRVVDDDRFGWFASLTNAKYSVDYGADFFRANALVRVTPVWAFGLVDDEFTTTPTRWSFGPS
jgi:PPOX class probable F420-dependent enzyme